MEAIDMDFRRLSDKLTMRKLSKAEWRFMFNYVKLAEDDAKDRGDNVLDELDKWLIRQVRQLA